MKNKVCVITGANSGIGKETAIELAKMGMHIVMVCRNREKGEMARQEIVEAGGHNHVDLLIADLSVREDIKHLADELKSRFSHIDVLINNAGTTFLKRQLNNEGHEMTFAVNYLAVFYLTLLVLPLLKAASQGRIIIVSSALASMGRIAWDDIDFKHRLYNVIAAYAQSKLMTIIFTKELAKRLLKTNVTINAWYPGWVATNLGIDDNNFFYKLGWELAKVFMVSAQKGAQTSVYLASSPEVSKISGQFWSNKKLRKNNPRADEPGVGKRLWELSEKILDINQMGI